MKIWITINPDENIPSDYIKINPQNLQTLTNSSCDEIQCGIIDYVPELYKFFILLISKLKYDGIIVVIGNDIQKICNNITYGKLSLNDGRNLLYGQKFSTYSTNEVIIQLLKLNLQIEEVSYQEYAYSISGKRVLKNG